jgi:hypothetical protein
MKAKISTFKNKKTGELMYSVSWYRKEGIGASLAEAIDDYETKWEAKVTTTKREGRKEYE